MKRALTVLGLAAVVVVAAYAIWQTNVHRPDTEALRVGVILPLTGPAAFLGDAIKGGIEIAAQEYRAGVEAKPLNLQIEYADSGGVPAQVVTAFHRLVSTKDVQAVIAVQHGVRALIPLAARDERVLLATSVPDNNIAGQNPWTFRFFINAETDASTIAAYARTRLGLERCATIFVNDEMGISYDDSFTRHFTAGGGTVVARESYPPAQAHFREQVLKVREAAPDCVYLIGYGIGMANLPKQIREAGMDATLLAVGTISQPEIMEAAGEAADGIYYTTTKFFTFAPETPELERFVESFQQRYGKMPVFFEVFGHDSLRLLLLAAEKGGIDPAGLRDGLAGIRNVDLAAGEVSVGEDNDVQFPVVVKKIVDGQWTPAP